MLKKIAWNIIGLKSTSAEKMSQYWLLFTGDRISFSAAISRMVLLREEQGSSTVNAQQRESNLNEG